MSLNRKRYHSSKYQQRLAALPSNSLAPLAPALAPGAAAALLTLLSPPYTAASFFRRLLSYSALAYAHIAQHTLPRARDCDGCPFLFLLLFCWVVTPLFALII